MDKKAAKNEGIDPAWFTTPAGAVAGTILVKALAKDPTWKKQLAGAAVGGGAGFAASRIPEMFPQVFGADDAPDLPEPEFKPAPLKGWQRRSNIVFGMVDHLPDDLKEKYTKEMMDYSKLRMAYADVLKGTWGSGSDVKKSISSGRSLPGTSDYGRKLSKALTANPKLNVDAFRQAYMKSPQVRDAIKNIKHIEPHTGFDSSKYTPSTLTANQSKLMEIYNKLRGITSAEVSQTIKDKAGEIPDPEKRTDYIQAVNRYRTFTRAMDDALNYVPEYGEHDKSGYRAAAKAINSSFPAGSPNQYAQHLASLLKEDPDLDIEAATKSWITSSGDVARLHAIREQMKHLTEVTRPTRHPLAIKRYLSRYDTQPGAEALDPAVYAYRLMTGLGDPARQERQDKAKLDQARRALQSSLHRQKMDSYKAVPFLRKLDRGSEAVLKGLNSTDWYDKLSDKQKALLLKYEQLLQQP